MTKTDFDAIVIGGGSGGLSFARNAAAQGARVALVERDRLGGTCVNRGCVPKKMLWTVARTLHDLSGLCAHGIVTGQAQVDLVALSRQRRAKIDGIVASYDDKLVGAGVTRIQGSATLSDGHVVVGDQRLSASHIVLATGGRPSRPSFDGAELCDTSDDALAWTKVPGRLAIVGAGYIGCEFAAIQAAFGAAVTLISDTDAVLTEFSPGLQRVAANNLRAQGVTLHLGCKPNSVTRTGEGFRMTLDDGAVMDFDKVLLATGRDVNTDVLGDLESKVDLTDGGHFATDDSLQTSHPNLFAVGDCADRLPLTPVAVDDGRVLAAQLFGSGATLVARDLVATAAFLLPPVAETGQRDRLCADDTSTPLKNAVLQDNSCDFWAYGSDSGALAAVSLAGDGAPEAIGLAAQLIAARHPLNDFASALPVHPTMTEGLLTAPYS